MQELYVFLLVLITPIYSGGGVGLSDNQISFSTNTVNGWQGLSGGSRAAVTVGENGPLKMESSLGHPLYLHPIEQSGTYIYNSKDELITRSGAPLPNDGNLLANDNSAKTRGSKYNGTDWTASFGVSAVLTNQNTPTSYFQNLKATPNGGSWVTNDPQYWPTAGSLSFYAYAPYCDDSHQMLSESADKTVANAKTVHYVASATDIVNQPDLIVANCPNITHGSTDAPTSVGLTFSHVLTAITFAVGSDMVPGTVKSIAIKGVKNEGDFDLSTNTWKPSSKVVDFTIQLGNGQGLAVTGKQDEPLTTGNQTLMMIPQAFDQASNAKVEIVFTPTGGAEKTLSASLANTNWDVGSTIIYKVSTSSLQPVLTTVKATFPTDWSSQKEYANKLKSAYANGDQLGLYVVSQEGKVKAANVQVTFNGTSWTLANQSIRFNANDHFFAYSPYTTDAKLLQGMPKASTTVSTTTLTSPHTFFKSLEDAWNINVDQSTRANFDASDLLVSKEVHSNNTGSGIDIAMEHAMGLADVALGAPGLNYKLRKDNGIPYTWTASIASNEFKGTIPFRTVCNHYVAVVRPNSKTIFKAVSQDGTTLWKNELSFSPSAPAAIEKHVASRADQAVHEYDLALGDLYYRDGVISHNTELWDLASINTPIGIVGYIGKDKWTEYNTGSGHGGHALVVGLTDLRGSYDTSGRASSSNTKYPASINDIKNPDFLASGYVVTKQQSNEALGFEAFKVVSTNQDKAPKDKSTGWFLPSIGQWYAFMIGLGGSSPTGWTNTVPAGGGTLSETPILNKINDAFQKVGIANSFKPSNNGQIYYWSATDTNTSNSYCWGMCNGFIGLYYNGTRDISCSVRPFLAF